MRLECISDLHGFYPDLQGADILIVCGDLTECDKPEQHLEFMEWLVSLSDQYQHIIYIAGNHDSYYVDVEPFELYNIHYLCDSCVVIDDFKFWGIPWTPVYHNWHFMKDNAGMEDVCAKIPEDVDVLITHGPSYGILDTNFEKRSCGSPALRNHVERVEPLVHVFGHIHEKHHKYLILKCNKYDVRCVNCSVRDEKYTPINKTMIVEI